MENKRVFGKADYHCVRCGAIITKKEYETDISFCKNCRAETIDA